MKTLIDLHTHTLVSGHAYSTIKENVEAAKEPLYTTKPNLERSGMGFTIMESFMDKMEVESVVGLGTKVTMSKKIKPKVDSEEDDFKMLMTTNS